MAGCVVGGWSGVWWVDGRVCDGWVVGCVVGRWPGV